MRTGVTGLGGWSWLGACALGLFACGGRTLDDGSYDAYGGQPSDLGGGGQSSDPAGSCRVDGIVYGNDVLIPGQCLCYCNEGQAYCESGCGPGAGGSAGSSSTGGSAGGGLPNGGTAGVSVAGSTGTGGVATGGSSTGGSSTGGASTVTPIQICNFVPAASGALPLIDDMEDGDQYIKDNEGRSGNWFTYNDGSANGYQFPDPGSPFGMAYGDDVSIVGKYVANTSGAAFLTWGAGMGLVLNSGCPYNASVYKAIRFAIKAAQPMLVRFIVATSATNPPEDGGTCVPTSERACYDAFQIPLMIGVSWATQTINFDQLAQQGWGVPAVFDATKLIGINFQTIATDIKFSLSVDSVSFY